MSLEGANKLIVQIPREKILYQSSQDAENKHLKSNPQFTKVKGLLKNGTFWDNTKCLNNNLELSDSSKTRKMPSGHVYSLLHSSDIY